MSRRVLGFGVGGILLGVGAEVWAFHDDSWQLWVPDLVTGWVLLGAALWVWTCGRASGTSWLLAATGVCWFVGSAPGTLYLHRGPFIHLLLTFPGWRPRTRLDGIAVAVAYLTAFYQPAWPDDPVAVLLAVGLVAVAVHGARSARPEDRVDRQTAAWAAGAFATAVVTVVVGTRASPDGSAVLPLLLVYETTVALTALALAARARGAPASRIADIVVELAAPPRTRLQEDLRQVLGDPLLSIGYWSPAKNGYVGVDGKGLDLDAGEPDVLVTPVGAGEPPAAVLVHHRDALSDPRVNTAVATAVQLSSRHRTLHAELARQRGELDQSRHRLLRVADQERTRLDRQLREGPEAVLDELSAVLCSIPLGTTTCPETDRHLTRAREHLTLVREELRDLSAGLMPRELATAGLDAGVRALAERAPVRVDLEVDAGAVPPEVARAAYFICSEALTNAVKHASASTVSLRVCRAGDRLVVEVCDDGRGGARPGGGSGLVGLLDRAEALGGSLTWDSPSAGGTRIVATLPLEGSREPSVPE